MFRLMQYLYMALLQTRVNNGDSKWRLNRAKPLVTTLGKTFLGDYFWKVMLRITEIGKTSQSKAFLRSKFYRKMTAVN